MKTESGKEVLRTQARKKLKAKKGERVPWHPRIKKLHKKLEEQTPEDNPTKPMCPLPLKKGITIYGTNNCHWCGEAKKYLDKKGKKYKYIHINMVKDYQETIHPLTNNYKYIPAIFIDGKFIGGYSELVARKNPPSRAEQFTKKDIVFPGEFTKTGFYPSANLLKGIKALRHQNREYFGFANHDTMWSHTNYEPTSAGEFESNEDRANFMKDNNIIIGFHTHPIRYSESVLGLNYWSQLSDVPSPHDYAAHLQEALAFGIRCEIVSTQHGFFIIRVEHKNKNKKSTYAMFEKDRELITTAWKGNIWGDAEPRTPGVHAQKTVKAINKKTKHFKFKVTFYDDPIEAIKWKPHEEKEDWVSVDARVRVNPAALSTEVEAHKQVEVQYQGQKFGVDELMAPLLMHLWDNGVHTLFSCQGSDFDDPKWEHWRSPNDPRERISPPFYTEDGEPGFYNSWTHGYILIDGGWEYVAHRLRDLLWTEGAKTPSTFEANTSAYRNGAEIWIESDYHKWGMMTHPKMNMTLQWRGRPDYENLRHIYDAFGLDFPGAKNNPPRSRAFPWNKQLVQRSPFKTMRKAQKTLDSWKEGNAIGGTASSSLKSMGKIPRSDGKYEVGYVMNNPVWTEEGVPNFAPFYKEVLHHQIVPAVRALPETPPGTHRLYRAGSDFGYFTDSPYYAGFYLFNKGNRQRDPVFTLSYLDIDNNTYQATHALNGGADNAPWPPAEGMEEKEWYIPQYHTQPTVFYTYSDEETEAMNNPVQPSRKQANIYTK